MEERLADSAPLTAKLHRLIDQSGPISVAQFMAEANMQYYATRDPLGSTGDFITAPEISQMFGELIGLWCADLWMRAGSPLDIHYVELGPGRGTLAKDALRALTKIGCTPDVHLVETSPVLRNAQAEAVPGATFHDDSSTLPQSGPLIIVANEFFDALPIRQLVATHSGWRERVVARDKGQFIAIPGTIPMTTAVPDTIRTMPAGTIIETSPASTAIMHDLASRIAVQGGAILTIDYGFEGPATGDTLQAMYRHSFANPFENVGNQDLTAHVDFTALGDAARSAAVRVTPVVDQGAWLKTLGIEPRAQALAATHPDRTALIDSQVHRLTNAEEMGTLFKVMAAYAPGWPRPEGFQE